MYLKEETQNEHHMTNFHGKFVLINHLGKMERQSVSDLVKLGF